MTVFLIVLAVLLVLLTAAGWYFSNIVIYPKCFGVKETYDFEAKIGKIEEEAYNKLPKEEVQIKSPFGYRLFGYYFPVEGSKKTVVICHGITYTLYGSVKYMDMFYKRGFNVLMYDHRNHGRSGGKNTTFGHYEKHDLKAAVDWVFKRCGSDCKVGVHGESMGAGVALQNAAIDPRVSFYVADCPYSDLKELLRYRLRYEYKLPGFVVLPMASLITWLRTGMSFGAISPVMDMSKIETPIFFVHGQNDGYIPNKMSVAMYERKEGAKKLYLAPNAGHAEAYWNNREEYDRLVGEFLEQNNI